MSEEPETIQVGIPKPRIMRAMMYMATVAQHVSSWKMTLGIRIFWLTVDRKPLNESTDNHNDRSAKDRPAPAETVVDNRD
jgi:hypothetical protein